MDSDKHIERLPKGRPKSNHNLGQDIYPSVYGFSINDEFDQMILNLASNWPAGCGFLDNAL